MKKILICLFLLGACTQSPDRPEPPRGIDDTDACKASAHANLVGTRVMDLERVYILGEVRIIRPNQAVTMDYVTERLNIEANRQGIIKRVFCG